jgi:hypothetical protein
MPAILASCLLLGSAVSISGMEVGESQSPRRPASTGVVLVHLPVLTREFPIEETIFGIEAQQLTAEQGLTSIDQAGARWTRRNAVRWDLVEPTPGSRNWFVLTGLDAELVDSRNAGLEAILIVRSTPSWAQAVPGYSCGRILPSALTAFASFMHDLVARYSVPPYEVKYWEIWNEPDVAPAQVVDPNGVYGCWGDPSQANFGGDYFAEMLEAVYPQIKLADPDAKVIIGGLLLDCDPEIAGACSSPYGDSPSRFLKGVLSHSGANDGHQFFDGVAIHAYDFYENSLGAFGNPNWGSGWNTTGPVSIAKKNFVQEELDSFGVTNKFIINTESALISDCCPDDPSFELTKAYYVAQGYSVALTEGFVANIWFNILGWRNSGLIHPDLSPRPAYHAFTVSREILRDATALGPISPADVSPINGVSGYKFERNGDEIWILWSKDGLMHQVSLLPGIPTETRSVFGAVLNDTSSPVIQLEPVYFLWD